MNDIDSVKTSRLLNKFQSMSEDEFTKIVVVPLLMRLDYRFVDYHGGQYEIGKDVICWKESDFGDKELTVVQVKKTKVAAAASVKNNFSEIITQLHQAVDEAVPSIFGVSQIPNQILFVTPYPISTRALEMAINGYQRLVSRGVKVLDGNRIAALVEKHLPRLTDDICGTGLMALENISGNVSNADLLSALNYTKDKRIADFYCDLDFGVGKVTTKFFFSLQFDPVSHAEKIAASKWAEFSKTIRATEVILDGCFISPTLDEIENKFRLDSDKWRSKSNIATIERIARLTIEAEETLIGLASDMSQMIGEALEARSEIDLISALAVARHRTDESQRKILVLKGLQAKSSRFLARAVEWKRISINLEDEHLDSLLLLQVDVGELLDDLRDDGSNLNHSSEIQLSLMFKNFKHLTKTIDELRKQYEKKIDEPFYELDIDGARLANLIEVQKSWLDQTLKQVSSGSASKFEVREFFVRCQSLFEKIGNLLENKLILEAIGIDSTQKFITVGAERITMPIRDVFNTGINCAVFGEAGAGKSTTLRMYSEQATLDAADDTVITLFLPLNRILGGVSKAFEFGQINSLKKLEQGLADYFSSSGKLISIKELIEFLHSKRRVIFVFDGLDEVIKTCPWIIDAINELEITYSNSQIILSSRSSGSYIDKVRYLSLTLLPFSDEQVLNFIHGWFSVDTAKAQLVEQHLCSTPSLMTIVRSPLLATILCVLADNGVPLPNGEIGMYSERMRLLLGHYDIHKKTKRTSSPNIILELVSRKLAFYLHSKNVRSSPHHVLEGAAVKISRDQNWGYSEDQVALAVSELIDPCNILVPMTDDGQFGFDHLRYQEFLAANEIIQNRGISLVPLLASPWWRSVFVIFARMTDNIHHIFSEILESRGHISSYRETLAAMASIRNPAEKRVLLGLLEKHSILDELDQDLKEFHDFDTEFDDVMSYRRNS